MKISHLKFKELLESDNGKCKKAWYNTNNNYHNGTFATLTLRQSKLTLRLFSHFLSALIYCLLRSPCKRNLLDIYGNLTDVESTLQSAKRI